MEGLKIGSAYFEIYAKAERLKGQMADYTGLVKKTADSFEEAFKNAKMDIDNRVLTMKFSQLQGLHKALLKQLEQKIKFDADVASIEKTRIAIKSVEDALVKTSGGVHKTNAAGLAFNRMIQDSAYVTQGLGFWLTSIGNNITNFAEQLSYGANKGQGFKTMLGSMFTGVNVWIMAISAAVTLLTIFANSSSAAESEQKKQKKSIEELTNSYKTLKEKISDSNEEIKRTKALDFDSTFRALQSELKKTTSEYERLIRKQKEYQELNKNSQRVPLAESKGSANFFFAPSKEEQKQLEEEIKKDEAKIKEAVRLGNLLRDAQKATGGGSLAQFMKNTSDADVQFVINVFKEWGSRMNVYQEETFNAFNQNITTTKTKAQELAKTLEEALNPKSSSSTKTEFGILQPLENQLKKLEALKPFAATIQQAADLQEAIKAVKNEIEEMQAAINIANRNTDLSNLQPLGVEGISRKNKAGSLTPLSKEEIDHLGDPLGEQYKKIREEIELTTNRANTFAGAISSGLVQGIAAGENFGDVLVRLTQQLTEMIAQALIFEALFALMTGGTGNSGGMFAGIFNKAMPSIVSTGTDITEISALPIYSAPTFSTHNNFNDGNIVQRLDALKVAVESNTIATIKGRGIASKANTQDLLKSIALMIKAEQNNLTSDNYKV